MKIIQYFILANICLSICYLFFNLISKKETNFRQLRFFLLVSIFISLLLPLNSIKINTGLYSNKSNITNPTYTQKLSIIDNFESEQIINQPIPIKKEANNFKNIDWIVLLEIIYISISILLIFRVIMQISQLIYRFYKSEKSRHLHYTILSNIYYKNSFSFFNWIFINKANCLSEDKDKIIAHEIIHASQFHSLDLILIELLLAVMWFNPAIWMMRKSMQLLHEYLADEGVLNTGIDKLSYQALIINQLTEEKLISISSCFNKSVKKRINMMSKSKYNQKSKMKILAIFPLFVLLFLSIACFNGLFPDTIKANPKNIDLNQSKDFGKFQSTEIIFLEDTTKNKKARKSRKDKISIEMKANSTVSESIQKTPRDSAYNVNDFQTKNLNYKNSDSIKHLALLYPNKTYFESMLTFPDFRFKTPSINSNSGYPKNILYIVDGVRTTINPISNLNANSIESISVIKAGSVFKHDGTVIIITSKLMEK